MQELKIIHLFPNNIHCYSKIKAIFLHNSNYKSINEKSNNFSIYDVFYRLLRRTQRSTIDIMV